MNKFTPLFIVSVVIIFSAGSFLYFMYPIGSSGPQATLAPYNSTMEITLYANAAGWNYNTSNPNPTIYARTHVLLEFRVIEQDTLPHTLTINPGPNESQASAIINVNIPPVPGTVVWANWSFSTPGVYKYWCIVHPETMVGKLVLNSSGNNSTATAISSNQPSFYLNGNSNTYGAREDLYE